VTIALNSDAHGIERLELIRYAVATARRAWLTADEVANTRPLRDFRRLCKGRSRSAA
jgi:DNA polymerase (family 10)